MADDVQAPAEAQGADTNDSGLYDLDSVDPDIREALTPHLKAIEGNVTKKLQEAADYRKRWAPYEELGLRDVDPNNVQQLLEFAKLANDPEQFKNWWKQAGEEQGYFEKEDDLDLEDLDDFSPEKIQELIDSKVSEKVSPIEQAMQTQQKSAEEARATEEVNAAFDKLQADNPKLFEGKDAESKEKVLDAVRRLAYSYSDDSSLSAAEIIQKGFEDYTNLIGQGEAGLFQQKTEQPKPAEGSGAPSTADEPITSFDDPRLRAQVQERLRKAS